MESLAFSSICIFTNSDGRFIESLSILKERWTNCGNPDEDIEDKILRFVPCLCYISIEAISMALRAFYDFVAVFFSNVLPRR